MSTATTTSSRLACSGALTVIRLHLQVAGNGLLSCLFPNK